MLLVDSGRFQYNGQGLSEQLNREYERTTTAHNSLTFDNKQQQTAPAVATTPAPNSSWDFKTKTDFASGISELYAGLVGNLTHQRGVLFVKQSDAGLPPYIVVTDVVSTSQARTVEASWHAHPRSNVTFHGDRHIVTITGVETATGTPSDAMLTLVPSDNSDMFSWTGASVVRGQVGNGSVPWQGWYSSDYNGNSTAPALVFNGHVPQTGATFGWLLIPQQHGSVATIPHASLLILPPDSTGSVQAQVSIDGKNETVVLPIGFAPPPPPPSPPPPSCNLPVQLPPCPTGMKHDVSIVFGNDGSCSCDEYCASDWAGDLHEQKSRWKGATSAYANRTDQQLPFHCAGQPSSSSLACACVAAEYYCPKVDNATHKCKNSCDGIGVPMATELCVPAGEAIYRDAA